MSKLAAALTFLNTPSDNAQHSPRIRRHCPLLGRSKTSGSHRHRRLQTSRLRRVPQRGRHPLPVLSITRHLNTRNISQQSPSTCAQPYQGSTPQNMHLPEIPVDDSGKTRSLGVHIGHHGNLVVLGEIRICHCIMTKLLADEKPIFNHLFFTFPISVRFRTSNSFSFLLLTRVPRLPVFNMCVPAAFG